jgi:DNA-binding response OmpR family regulator
VQSVRSALEGQGYRVVTAEDGDQALALAERAAPDLVIVDMMIPRRSGFLVVQKVKSRPHHPPPVIMMTANESARHRDYAKSLGVDDYFSKPLDMGRLMESVRRLCPRPEIANPN